MNKKIIILGLGALIGIISCSFLKKNEQQRESEVSNAVANQIAGSSIVTAQPPEPKQDNPEASAPSHQKPVVTHYDTKKLDAEVREEALRMGKDPARYRKIVREEPDGTKIYRQIGMHVIVSPNQEEVFLPDEI
jgi:hypothetical protein